MLLEFGTDMGYCRAVFDFRKSENHERMTVLTAPKVSKSQCLLNTTGIQNQRIRRMPLTMELYHKREKERDNILLAQHISY